MDTIKFKLFKNPNGRPHVNIYINGTNLANMIVQSERLAYKQKVIDFLWSWGYCGLAPSTLLNGLLCKRRASIMGDKDWIEYNVPLCNATIIETESTIIWADLANFSRRKKKESVINLLERRFGGHLQYGEG
ncbi:MAG: hypothetical protein LBN71_03845, partial [Tannerella sp.]|nr:hypothetical protein [Tannerella sp.]